MSRDIGEIVPITRGISGVEFSDEVKARCFVLYSTMAARNCSHVERLYREEVAGTDEPVPTRTTIARWASVDHWHEQADDLQRNTRNWSEEQLRHLSTANAYMAEKRRHDVLMGLYEGREMQGALVLKAGELADRKQERLLPLERLQPPPKPVDTSTMTRAELEAHGRAQNIQRKQRGSA